MPLTSIVTVVLRLYAISWFLHAVITLVGAGRDMFRSWAPQSAMLLAVPAGYLIVSLLLFMWSHLVARIVTPRNNPEVATGNLTLHDLYCFAFVFLGLYFVLTSIADVLNWIHYAVMTAQESGNPEVENSSNFYHVTHHIVTLVAGGCCLLFAPRCARKLTALQRKHESITTTGV